MKAMILAAGFGTRMRPFTNHSPKPLVPLNGIPLIVYTLAWLKRNGIREVVINLHHQGEKIVKLFGNGKRVGLRIHYSREPVILGTGGGIRKALKFFDGDFLVINGDIVFDLDLKKLVAQHCKSRLLATLVVRPEAQADRYGALWVSKRHITAMPGCSEFGQKGFKTMFAGIHLISKSRLVPLLTSFPKNKVFCIVREVYAPHLKNSGLLGAFVHKGFWRVNDSLKDVRETERMLKQSLLS